MKQSNPSKLVSETLQHETEKLQSTIQINKKLNKDNRRQLRNLADFHNPLWSFN